MVQIDFVAHEQKDTLVRVVLDLSNPSFHTVKRFSLRDVVHNQCAIRASVIRTRNGSEPLLSCSIPERMNGPQVQPSHVKGTQEKEGEEITDHICALIVRPSY